MAARPYEPRNVVGCRVERARPLRQRPSPPGARLPGPRAVARGGTAAIAAAEPPNEPRNVSLRLAVPFSRLQLDEYLASDSTDPLILERVTRLPHQRNQLIYHVSRLLRMELRMARDQVVVNNTSLNNTLYIVRTGKVIVFGNDPVHPFAVDRCTENDYFGEDICMCLSSTSDEPNPSDDPASRMTRRGSAPGVLWRRRLGACVGAYGAT